MQKNPQFKFELSVSKEYYRQKPTGLDYARMKWQKRSVSVSEMISLIRQGYSYCHIYFNNLRRKDKFLHTNIVSIDVDDADLSLADFISDVQLKPTFAYETFSNSSNGKFSYRLVYVMSEQMRKYCFIQVYDKICRMTGLSDTKDHCGRTITQLMNGTNHSAYIYRSDLIYSTVTDLPVDATIHDQIEESKSGLIPLVNPNKFHNNNYIHNNTQKQYKTNGPFCTLKNEVLNVTLQSLYNLGREGFLSFYKTQYRLIRWSKLAYNEYGYTVIPEDHLSLFVRYKRIGKECRVDRFRDGEKRRNRLFIDGCIIRKIHPDVSIYELFYNLLHRLYWYYDNSDGVLSDSVIAQKAIDVMEYEVDSMTFQSMDAGRITTSAAYCRNHGISRTALSRKAMQIEHFASIREWYDTGKSVI